MKKLTKVQRSHKHMATMEKLKVKQSLSISDATFLLQFIQEQTAPILSLRNSSQLNTTAVVNGGGICPVESLKSEASTEIHSREKHCSKTMDGEGLVSDSSLKAAITMSRPHLDITSLEDFPPMSVAMQDRRFVSIFS